MATLGNHPLGFPVSDIEATAGFFVDCLGWFLAREVPEHRRHGPAKHFMAYEPSGIRMKFIWVP